MLGEALLGALDYWRYPQDRVTWGGPFNGQQARRALFHALIERSHPSAIIETGTFRGMTTEFMSAAGLPIFTIENNRRLYGFARMRLLGKRNVAVFHGDSRKVLRDLFAGPLRKFQNETLFVYLDAHWENDLPTAEELEIVFQHAPAAIVMADDFEVPFDPGYRYDKYKSGKELTWNYIAPAVEKLQLTSFFPATLAADETGARRGCIVLAREAAHGPTLRSLDMLRLA